MASQTKNLRRCLWYLYVCFLELLLLLLLLLVLLLLLLLLLLTHSCGP